MWRLGAWNRAHVEILEADAGVILDGFLIGIDVKARLPHIPLEVEVQHLFGPGVTLRPGQKGGKFEWMVLNWKKWPDPSWNNVNQPPDVMPIGARIHDDGPRMNF